ncbi:hypothetical protein [Streptomyces sp. NPDC056525]|uniref:hypothetical protein n=1 Tax=unclassified Streptomyces TaxID=2593676 RepID=UPI0036CBA117
MLEEAGVGYVLAVPKSQQVKSPAGIWRIDQLISEAPHDAWQRLSAGDGAKGPRIYDWASAKLPVIDFFDGDERTHRRWVLARRSIKRPDEIAYYLAYAPTGTTVAELVRIAGSRWAIEEWDVTWQRWRRCRPVEVQPVSPPSTGGVCRGCALPRCA